ncbi:unnamed protein product (macronuclear) [Paramecium tetraurelia]|uniref:UDENN domain-containing protein n=1 Tax=Paramecium tetraurelia TaxID=5888 RepID=A0BY10_PARTE|nr:uncharacterized protein GSPATT00033280001 [Paramecium tetraurelia]CAK63427.1 unnamed protein product [Paramecium tetraurelia]|eukprot:XP_001430825.1 hypothetical protein (macronuclear) [Paramecium tetraurelia strain d4-2]
MQHSQPSTQDKDKPHQTPPGLSKSKVQHNDDVDKIIADLKRVILIANMQKLEFEQERNLLLEKDNTQLKDLINRLLSQPVVQTQSTHTQTEFYKKELEQLNTKEDSQLNIGSILNTDYDPITSQDSPTKLDNTQPKKPDLRIEVSPDHQQLHGAPNSNVKKSSTYLQGLTNIQIKDAITDGIPQKTNRIGQKIGEGDNSLRKSMQLNFLSNKSSITDTDHVEGQDLKINSVGNQSCIESIEDIQDVQQPALKLYEQFYILGCEKKEFGEFEQDPNIKEGILPTSILYKSDQLNISIQEEIIKGFVYPFGNQIKRIETNDSVERLKQIIYSCNKYELLDKFSVFAIKNHDTTQDFVEYTNQNLMYQANPEKLLYGIYLTVDDYVETTPDHIVSNFENREKRIFWKYKKTYCFLTYFPFYELFQDLLISIIYYLELIKFNRSNRWMMNIQEENEIPKEIDGQQIILEFRDELTKFLDKIQAITPMQGHQMLEIPTLASLLKYKIPNQLNLDIDLRLWSANVTLQVLNYNEILTIFLAMMSEVSIIFVCQNSSILTSIVHFFHHLIRPLEWTQAIIYNVPEQLLEMIQSPVPIIIGVNLPEIDFQSLELTNYCINHLFVFLDGDQENKFLRKASNILEGTAIPSFRGLLQQIQGTLENYNQMRNQSPSKRQFNKFDDKKVIKFYFDEIDQRTSQEVLQGFKKIINDYIISRLPAYNVDGVIAENGLEFEYIEFLLSYNNDEQDRKFIQNLMKTQYFNYFMQQHYEAQM